MWKNIIGFSLLAVVLVAGAGFGYLNFRSPAIAPSSNIKVDTSPARVARGKYIYLLANCDGCHSPANRQL